MLLADGGTKMPDGMEERMQIFTELLLLLKLLATDDAVKDLQLLARHSLQFVHLLPHDVAERVELKKVWQLGQVCEDDEGGASALDHALHDLRALQIVAHECDVSLLDGLINALLLRTRTVRMTRHRARTPQLDVSLLECVRFVDDGPDGMHGSVWLISDRAMTLSIFTKKGVPFFYWILYCFVVFL